MSAEASARFECFGSRCSLFVIGDGHAGSAAAAVEWARAQLLEWHDMFTRFHPLSELSQLNADRRHAVPVSATMARFAELAIDAAGFTGGLVDATLLGEIEIAGYTADLGSSVALADTLGDAPQRRPARPNALSRWQLVRVDSDDNVIFRPPGVMLDSGGLAKGLFCDLLAVVLESYESYAVDCGGDVRIGGRGKTPRVIQVGSPFDESILHRIETDAIAAATSGIGRRSWIDASGKPAHHLLDPSTGRPAYTGIVQATAFASSAGFAEVCAKAALLSGREGAPSWLPYGGVLVHENGVHEVVAEVMHA
jgi:thiamine biosynthesis lipoprotein